MRQLTLGATTIDRVAELDAFWVDPQWLYPNVRIDMVARHEAALGARLVQPATRKLCLSFHSYVVRTRGRTILVDTCNGHHKPRMPWEHALQSSDYLANLARLGLRPHDIDVVLCTHLHTDHVGWNTRLVDGRWVPTFPKARYVMAQREFEHAMAMVAGGKATPVGRESFLDSVLPLVEGGRVDLVGMDHVLDGDLGHGVWLEAAVGHTPGHVNVHVQGGGAHAIISGDVVHHPILFLEPTLVNLGDWDAELAARTRQRLFERCADTSTLLLTMHFPPPTAGRLASTPDGFRFRFLEA